MVRWTESTASVHESIGFIKLGPLVRRSTAWTKYTEGVSAPLIVAITAIHRSWLPRASRRLPHQGFSLRARRGARNSPMRSLAGWELRSGMHGGEAQVRPSVTATGRSKGQLMKRLGKTGAAK
jgi:hypothetical protein